MNRSKEQAVTITAAAIMLAGAMALGTANAQDETQAQEDMQSDSMMDPVMDSMTGMMIPMLAERAGEMVNKMDQMRENGEGYMRMMGEMSSTIDRLSRMSGVISETTRSQMSMGEPMPDKMYDACMMMDMGTVKDMNPDDRMMEQCDMMGNMMRMHDHIGTMASMMMDVDMQSMEMMMDEYHRQRKLITAERRQSAGAPLRSGGLRCEHRDRIERLGRLTGTDPCSTRVGRHEP